MKMKLIVFALFLVSYFAFDIRSFAKASPVRNDEELNAVTWDVQQLELIIQKDERRQREAKLKEEQVLSAQYTQREAQQAIHVDYDRGNTGVTAEQSLKADQKAKTFWLLMDKQAKRVARALEMSLYN